MVTGANSTIGSPHAPYTTKSCLDPLQNLGYTQYPGQDAPRCGFRCQTKCILTRMLQVFIADAALYLKYAHNLVRGSLG